MPILWLITTLLGAPVCDDVQLDAQLAADFRTISGTVTCTVSAGGQARIATYPRLLREPWGLDDVSSWWSYPNGFSAADMQLWRNHAPLLGDGAWQPMGVVQVGQVLQVSFKTNIPERDGTFGRMDGAAYLLGGWHPALGAVTARDDDQDALVPVRVHYRIEVPTQTVGFVGRTPFGRTSPRRQVGMFVGRYVPLMAAPAARIHRDQRVRDAVLVVPDGRKALDRQHPERSLRELTSSLDVTAHMEIMATLADGAAFARSQNVSPTPLIAVIAPLRTHLVEVFEGGLAISDRAFHVVPWELVRRFHRASIWREQFRLYAQRYSRRLETELPPDLIADLTAAALRQRLWSTRYDSHDYAPDLLEKIAVIPEIDALIFAPQVPFIDTYYNAIDETPRRRIGLDDFYQVDHPLPRGKVLYEKLRDRLGETATQTLIGAYLQGTQPFLETPQARQAQAERWIRPWLGAYPQVNYRLSGVDATSERITVQVGVEGPDAGAVDEPLTVAVVDAAGAEHQVTRDGPGALTIEAPGPAQQVQLDPNSRLVELWHPPGQGPRFDNRVPPRWRFLLNNITGLLAITNQQLTLAADFTLRRIHDLRYDLEFYAMVAPRAISAAAIVSYNFGSEITPLRLAESHSLTIAYNRLRVESDAAVAGDEITLSYQYDYDTRLNPYASFSGQGASLLVTTGAGRREDGHYYAYGQVGAAGLQIFQLALDHAILVRLRGDIILGDAATQDRLRLGGRYHGGRGFENDEGFGVQRILLSTEYRHVLQGQSRNDFYGLLMLTRLEGALFADAIYLPVQQQACDQTMFFDVGYGVRLLMDIINISPASVQLDVGIPIHRCPNQAAARVPLSVYLAFVQSFASF